MVKFLLSFLCLMGCAWSENQGLALADFDGDGQTDIALIRTKELVVFPKLGLDAPWKCPTETSMGPLARGRVVDLGLDGRPDLIVVGPQASLWRSARERVWTAPEPDWTDAVMLNKTMVGVARDRLVFYAMNGARPELEREVQLLEEGWSLCLQDMDADKQPDLVIGCVGCNDVLLLCSGDRYQTLTRRSLGKPVGRVVAGDFDGDGKPDLVSVLEPEIRAHPARGKDVVYPLESVNAYDVVRADLDGDGLPDVALLAKLGLRIFPGIKRWLLSTSGFHDLRDPDTLACGDLDSDGRPDLVLGYHYEPYLWLLYNQGRRGFRKVQLEIGY